MENTRHVYMIPKKKNKNVTTPTIHENESKISDDIATNVDKTFANDNCGDTNRCDLNEMNDISVDKKLKRKIQVREANQKYRDNQKKHYDKLKLQNKQLTTEVEQLKYELHKKTDSMQLHFANVYNVWYCEHNNLIQSIHKALITNYKDSDIIPILNNVMDHFKHLFYVNNIAAKRDALNIIYGVWMKPTERCIMWVGGFRPSDILKLINTHVYLTDLQSKNINELQSSTIHQERKISNTIANVEQKLAVRLVSDGFKDKGDGLALTNYIAHISQSMGNFHAMETYLHQADQLRLNILSNLQQMLTTKQFAESLLCINAYFKRIEAINCA
ncbi:transcription factor TGA2.1-like [Rutidosis leptorrhynchoides]|uniref:transcription factor TGA2.1-like n=1 Tax=Rutidosis leptorrhynchoides TaxID=125765 RepID=UPI003A9A14B0